MAETATKTTTPRRPRAATKAAPAAKPAAKTVAKAAAPVEEPERERYVMSLEYTGDTKSYAVFVPPSGSGCVGKFYAPLGTEEVKVQLAGPADAVAPE